MQNETLRLVTYKEDPSEQVIWNQERPIAYLNRGDASIDEFIELENLIQSAPKMLKALESIATIIKGSKTQMENQIDFARRTANEAISKVKGEDDINDLVAGLERAADLFDDIQERKPKEK